MSKVVRIPSKAFFALSERGSDKLVAVYATLKHCKNGDIKYYAYTAKNNKFVSGYNLLRNKTNLSLCTLKKYVPLLIEMGLCSFHINGDFVLLGGEKTKELFSSFKLVPIVIGKNITTTQYNCLSVKVHSAERQQLKKINQKKFRSELLNQTAFNWKAYKKAKKIGVEEITDKTILSNQGFAKLKDGTEDNASKGSYWKSRLVKHGIIKSTRRYLLGNEMSYATYIEYKGYFFQRGMTYKNGCLAQEIIAGFTAIDLVNKIVSQNTVFIPTPVIKVKEEIKPLSHLSFDMVAWWSKN